MKTKVYSFDKSNQIIQFSELSVRFLVNGVILY